MITPSLFLGILLSVANPPSIQERGCGTVFASLDVYSIIKHTDGTTETNKIMNYYWYAAPTSNNPNTCSISIYSNSIIAAYDDTIRIQTEGSAQNLALFYNVQLEGNKLESQLNNSYSTINLCQEYTGMNRYRIDSSEIKISSTSDPDTTIIIPILRQSKTGISELPATKNNLLTIQNRGIENNILVNDNVESVSIYDVIGREIYSEVINGNTTPNKIKSNLEPNNIYIIKIHGRNGVQSRKLYLQ